MIIRNFFTNFDMFGAFPTFRMRGEPETVNLCGGISSLLILLFFVYIFIISALEIVNYRKIEARVINQLADRGEDTFDFELNFAIGVKYFNYPDVLAFF